MIKTSLMEWWRLPLPQRKELVSNAAQQMFAKILDFLNSRYVTCPSRKPTCLEMTIFYINQANQSYKDNKKVYYCDFCVLGQVTPCLNHSPSPKI